MGVAADARYWRGNYQLQQYYALSRQYTLAFEQNGILEQNGGRGGTALDAGQIELLELA